MGQCKINNFTAGQIFVLLCTICISKHAFGLTLSGPFIATDVTVGGDVTVNNLTSSSLTVTNSLITSGATIGLPGRIIHTYISSATVYSEVDYSTWTPIGISREISLSNSNNYFRISLGGNLWADGTPAYITIFRGNTNLGDTDFGLSGAISSNNPGNDVVSKSVGITIVDKPNDINQYLYQVNIRLQSMADGNVALFGIYSVPYLLIEEIEQ